MHVRELKAFHFSFFQKMLQPCCERTSMDKKNRNLLESLEKEDYKKKFSGNSQVPRLCRSRPVSPAMPQRSEEHWFHLQIIKEDSLNQKSRTGRIWNSCALLKCLSGSFLNASPSHMHKCPYLGKMWWNKLQGQNCDPEEISSKEI